MDQSKQFKRKISVRLHPRLAEADKQGYCPLRLTARWHGQEIQENTGERVLHAQGKTGNDAAVPLPPIAVHIGERWGWKFPARTWQQRGEWIKEVAQQADLTREWDDRLITGGKVVHNWRPVHQVIGTHTARHTAGTLLKQASNGNKALAKLVLGHAEEDVTDRYAKNKARLLALAVLEAWQAILGDWYDGEPAR